MSSTETAVTTTAKAESATKPVMSCERGRSSRWSSIGKILLRLPGPLVSSHSRRWGFLRGPFLITVLRRCSQEAACEVWVSRRACRLRGALRNQIVDCDRDDQGEYIPVELLPVDCFCIFTFFFHLFFLCSYLFLSHFLPLCR